MEATKTGNEAETWKPVRMVVRPHEHERLSRLARSIGLTRAAYVRMALIERMDRQERAGSR